MLFRKFISKSGLLLIPYSSLLIISLLPIPLSAQYTIEKVDSIHYRFCTTVQDQNGGISKNCSAPTTRDSAAGYLASVADRQRAYNDAKPWERDWNAIDSALKKYTGRTYAQHVQDQASASLSGDWEVIYSGDTISIKISKSLKVTGGTLRGDVELIDNKSLKLSGILSKTVTLTAEKGRLAGKLEGKEVFMKKV